MSKNGKVFGKINLIDLLVIVLALVVVLAVALKLTGVIGSEKDKGTDITYTVLAERVNHTVYTSIQESINHAKSLGWPGDQLMANGKMVDGYITNVTAKTHDVKAELNISGDYMAIYPVEEDTMDLTFTIQAHVDSRIRTDVGTQEVRIGHSHIIKTTHFELGNGLILTCEWEDGTVADAKPSPTAGH